MPIEFVCPNCQKLLRVPDQSAGQQAKCPSCGQLTTIPAASSTGSTPPSIPPAPAFSTSHVPPQPPPAASGPFDSSPEGNPYATPEYLGTQSTGVDSEAARSKVQGPAVAIMVLAGMGALGCLAVVAFGVLQALLNNNVAIEDRLGGLVGSSFYAVGAIGDLFVLFAMNKMRKLEGHGLAVAASILMIVFPCFGMCCLLNLPFSIWALVVLFDPNVKRAFRE